jgi:hypothetical protein
MWTTGIIRNLSEDIRHNLIPTEFAGARVEVYKYYRFRKQKTIFRGSSKTRFIDFSKHLFNASIEFRHKLKAEVIVFLNYR